MKTNHGSLMSPYCILLLSLFYFSCECCRPDIKLGDKYLDPETVVCLPSPANLIWVYTNQYLDTLKLYGAQSRDTINYIVVDILCTKGFDRQVKYWNGESIHYFFHKDTFLYRFYLGAQINRLMIDTMLFDYIFISMNGLGGNKITSLRNMDTSRISEDDLNWLNTYNDFRDSSAVTLHGKTFYNVWYIVANDTSYSQDSLSCRELYYSAGVGAVGFKLKNGMFWVYENTNTH